jgi:hypothetical protein
LFLERRRLQRFAALALVPILTAACSGQTPAGVSQPFLNPERITIQDLLIAPSPAASGAPTRIRFRLVRNGDVNAPIYWSAHLFEQPAVGGKLSDVSGGPIVSGGNVELTYLAGAATTAIVSLYPSSTAGASTGDGSGDWRSITIVVPGA